MTSPQLHTDVCVIGGGPAGSTLAALLALRGISVVLVDRDTFPRDKLCGEFLSYDALPVVEALGVDLGDAPHITRCRVVGRKRTYEFALPHPARGISRMTLDALLFRTAIARGATDRSGCTATSLDANRVTLDDGTVIVAKAVAGAWGRWGRFDQQLARAFVRDRTHRNFGFKRHYRARSDDARDTIELYSFARGYLGVNAVEEGLTNICGLVHASRLAGHRGRWESFIEQLRSEERPLDTMYARYEPAQEGFLSSEPVIFRARSSVEHGIFMIGDASGVIDPLTGNGMAMAIQSALVAAPFLAELVAGRERGAIENAYREQHRRLFAPRIAWSRRVAKLLSRPALLDAALVTLRSTGIGPFLLGRTRGSRDETARMAEAWTTVRTSQTSTPR